MKQILFQEKTAITSKAEYLSALGRRLTWHFPFQQVLEILADYQEYLSIDHEQGATMETIVTQWGSPKNVAAKLLEECPEARPRFYKHLASWLCMFLVALYAYFYVPYGPYVFLTMISLSLFGFFHLGKQASIEYKFSAGNDSRKKDLTFAGNIPLPLLAVHCALPILVLLAEKLVRYVIKHVEALPERIGPLQIGFAIGYVSNFFQILVLLLLIWMIVKTIRTSVHYFPAAVHAMGALLFIVDTRSIFFSMDLSATGDNLLYIFAQCLIVYGLGVGLAIFFQMLLSMYATKDDTREQSTQGRGFSQDNM